MYIIAFQNGFVECTKDQCPDEQGCYMLQDVFVDQKGCCRRCKGTASGCVWGGRERGRSVFFSRHAVMFDPFVYYRLRTQGRPAGERHGMDGSRRPVHGEVVQGGRDHGDPNAVHHAVSATVPAETGHLLSHLSR